MEREETTMSWPLEITYTLTHSELADLLSDACWQVWQEAASGIPFQPSARIDEAVNAALDSLWMQALTPVQRSTS